VSARPAIILVVSVIARDVAHDAQACTSTREFNQAPARSRWRMAEGKWQESPPLQPCGRDIPVYDITLSNANFKGLPQGAFISLNQLTASNGTYVVNNFRNKKWKFYIKMLCLSIAPLVCEIYIILF
jgi:hypothetical protein